MAYTKLSLENWLTAHAGDEQFPDVVAGAPLIYAAEATVGAGAPTTADAWTVVDFVSELPEIEQELSTIDVSTTGLVSRKLIKGVPDAPSAISFPVPDATDDVLDGIDVFAQDYATAKAAGKVFYIGYYRKDAKTTVFGGAPGIPGVAGGAFADAFATTLSVVPDLSTKQRITITV